MRLPALLTALMATWLAAPPARAQNRPEIRAFWADGFNEGFKTPEQVDTLIKRLQEAHCNAIFAQMRKRGDAYYLSRYEPWASDDPGHWDALSYLIEKAHAARPPIQVHAWINTCAVGGWKTNPFHIVTAHPEWLSLSDKGADYDDEATKIDPGNPDAADWTFRIYLDVLRHYQVDGVHFDFVRYGGANWGYNPVSVARYNARYGAQGQPDAADPRWRQWRRDQVTALVRKVYAMAAPVAPRAAISAATITWGDGPQDLEFWNEKTAAMTRVYQDWRAWMREGILDLNCLMSYYSEQKYPGWFRHWIDWAKDNQYGHWVVPSSGIWLNPIEGSLKQIAAIRARSRKGNRSHGVLLYSYAGTNAGPDGKEQNYNDDFYRALGQPSQFAAKPPFPEPAAFPPLPWKENPRAGVVKGFVLTADALNPADGAVVTLTGRGFRRAQRTDGTGFYAFVGVPSGSYRVRVQAEGYTARQAQASVRAGRATTANSFVGSDPAPETPSVGACSDLPDGAPVRLLAVRVLGGTDNFPGCLYVYDGPQAVLRVRLAERPILPFQAGDVVALRGVMAHEGAERILAASVARLVDIQPFDAMPRSLTGTELGAATGWAGRLVRVRGQVDDVKPGRFTLRADGTPIEVVLGGRKDPGVEAVETPLVAPEPGSWVDVTGIPTVSRSADGAALIRLRPRIADDIRPVAAPMAARLVALAQWGTPALFGSGAPLADKEE